MTIPDLMPEGDIRRLLTHAAAATGQTPPTAGAARARRTARTRTATHAAGVIAAVATVATIIVGVPIALALTTNDTVLQPQPAAPSTHQTPSPTPTPTARSATTRTPTPTARPATTRTPTPSATPTITTPETTTPPPQPGAGSLDGYIPLALADTDPLDLEPDGSNVSRDPFWAVHPCHDTGRIDGTNLPDGVLDAYTFGHSLGDGSVWVVAVVLADEASAAAVLDSVEDGISRCGDPATAPEDSTGTGTWIIVERGGYGDEALHVVADYYPTEEAIAGGMSSEVWWAASRVIVRTGNVVFLYGTGNTEITRGDVRVASGAELESKQYFRTLAAEELAHLEAHLQMTTG